LKESERDTKQPFIGKRNRGFLTVLTLTMTYIFGSIADADVKYTVVVMIVTCLLLIITEKIIKRIGHWFSANMYAPAFHNVQSSFMLLGMASFLLFIAESFESRRKRKAHADHFEGFNFTHILIVFLALSFGIQAILLVMVSLPI
jgi:hypothetical protein